MCIRDRPRAAAALKCHDEGQIWQLHRPEGAEPFSGPTEGAALAETGDPDDCPEEVEHLWQAHHRGLQCRKRQQRLRVTTINLSIVSIYGEYLRSLECHALHRCKREGRVLKIWLASCA
eukprot:5938542-Amphidinium_carterae.1